MYKDTDHVKRITVNLPFELLFEAKSCTGLNTTDTLVEGLKLVTKSRAYELANQLKGRLHLDINMRASRERCR